MDPEFWHARWREGKIGFHQDQVHADLLAHADRVTDGVAVLVPLCGKSVDLPWLAARLPTVGVELSEIAVAQLFEELGVEPTIDDLGPIRRYRSGDLTVLQGDLFDVMPAHLPAGLDRVWDRAALVALDPPRRRRYAAYLRAVIPSGRLLLNSFTYDPSVMEGPPHSVSSDEIRTLYAGARIALIDERDELTERFRDLGHSWWQTQVHQIDW